MEERFWKTKSFLFKVREQRRQVELIRRRADLCDTDELQRELAGAEQALKSVTIEVMELIGRLPDINQQMVITKRYVDMLTWDDIAGDMNMSVRAVQKYHGRALPLLQEIIEGEKTA